MKKLVSVMLTFVMLMSIVAIGGNWSAEIIDGLMLKASAVSINLFRRGEIVEFGWYPQTKVTDTSIISALNSSDSQWYSYGYYSGTGSWYDGQMQPSDYMRYTDVMYDGNKYRGVVFDSYRPYLSGYTSSENEQQGNRYYTNNIYWFKL